MAKFSNKHKQDLQFILSKFNKYVVGEKCTAVEVAETVARIMEMHSLETCDCKQKVNERFQNIEVEKRKESEERVQKAAQLKRMKKQENGKQDG